MRLVMTAQNRKEIIMSKLRPKIVQLAKMVGGISGVVNKIDENAPGYYCRADILTDE